MSLGDANGLMADSSNENNPQTFIADIPKAVCDAYVKILAQGVDVQRCAAARALGSLGHPDGVEPLIESLLDEDPDVRADAAEALGRYKDERAAAQLLDNFIGDPDTDVKRNALQALTDMRYAPVQEWLEKLLREEDDEIQWDEVDFIEREWDDREDFRVLAVENLGHFKGAAAIEDIAPVLDDEFGQDMMEPAFRTLITLGDEGVALVGKYLSNKAERPRRRAAAALAASASPAAERLTGKALQDEALDVRLSAARVLAGRNGSDPRLEMILADANPMARAEGMELCGVDHREWITRHIDDKEPSVRIAALKVLAENPEACPDRLTVEAVRECIVGKADQPSPDDVIAIALKAYVALGGKDAQAHLLAIAEDSDRSEELRLATVEGLSVLGGELAVNCLTRLAADEKRQVRLNSLAALVKIVKRKDGAMGPATQALFGALHGELIPIPIPMAEEQPEEVAFEPEVIEQEDEPESDEITVVEDAVEEDIPNTGPTSTLDALLEANEKIEDFVGPDQLDLTPEDEELLASTKDKTGKKHGRLATPAPYDDVRRFAARVMGDLSGDDVANELAGCLRDQDFDLAVTAADSLARIAEDGEPLPYEAVQALMSAFSTGERDLRMQALRALANDTGGNGPGVLADGIQDADSFVRIEALRGLGNRRCAGPECVESLSDVYPEVRLTAARAIAKTAAPDALDVLADYAFSFEAVHCRQAASLIKALDRDAASMRMIEIIENEEQNLLWQSAVEILESLSNADEGTSP